MRVSWRIFGVLAAMNSVGCEESLYGSAGLYVYNGTEIRTTVKMSSGDESREFLLRPGTGQLFGDETAGKWTFTIAPEDGAAVSVFAELPRDTFSVLNIDGAGCFARADVSGMYIDGRPPVKVNETFTGENLFSMKTQVDVAPGERLPKSKPKSPFGFHRLAVVPCSDLSDKYALAKYIKELH